MKSHEKMNTIFCGYPVIELEKLNLVTRYRLIEILAPGGTIIKFTYKLRLNAIYLFEDSVFFYLRLGT